MVENQNKDYQNFNRRLILKDLPFYRRYPRTFAIVGSSLGFCILFSKAFYDILKSDSVDDIKKKLYVERLKQLKLQKEIEFRKELDK